MMRFVVISAALAICGTVFAQSPDIAVEELTLQQGKEMEAAARAVFERQQVRVVEARKQVEGGSLPRLALTPYLEELDRARRAMDLAHFRVTLLTQIEDMARLELEAMLTPPPESQTGNTFALVERYHGDGLLPPSAMKGISQAFEQQFSRRLPVSAQGSTAVHRAMGYDHRGRVDVAVDPDQPEGVWLRRYLESLHIPYYAFRSAVPGAATGPHIHIGPPSERISRGG